MKPLLAKPSKGFGQFGKLKRLVSKKKQDVGNRGAVTGGRHLDGFLDVLVQVSVDIGVPRNCLFLKGNTLPGYFRPTKNWDFLVMTPRKELIAAVELKSQVGSFGNNFNNRSEEAIGSAVDFWTAFRENGFNTFRPPWVGYMFLVEKSAKSTSLVRIAEPHFDVRNEFKESSYLDRYRLLCQKLMLEKHYTSTAVLWTNEIAEFGSLEESISIQSFLLSLMGHLQSKSNLF